MRSFLITSETEWETWRPQWTELSQRNPMTSMEWLIAWRDHFGPDASLSIVAAEDQGRLVGFVPLCRQKGHLGDKLHSLGAESVCSDYVSAVVDPARAEAVRQCLVEPFQNTSIWRNIESLTLEGIASDDPWISQLYGFAAAHDFSMRVTPFMNSWVLELPSSWEAFLLSLRKHKIVRKLKKANSRLESGAVQRRYLVQSADVDEGVSHLKRLHQARRRSVGDEGCFSDPRFEPFLRQALDKLMKSRRAAFTLCEVDNTVIGVQLNLLSNDRVYMYQSGIDPQYLLFEPGYLTTAANVMWAIETGRTQFDFLRGDEPYKAHWQAERVELSRVIIAPPTLKAQAVETVARNLLWLKSCYKDWTLAKPNIPSH